MLADLPSAKRTMRAGRGRDQAGDETEMLLDLRRVVLTVRPTADEQGVDGRVVDRRRRATRSRSPAARAAEPAVSEMRRTGSVDYACHGQVLPIMQGTKEERKRPPKPKCER